MYLALMEKKHPVSGRKYKLWWFNIMDKAGGFTPSLLVFVAGQCFFVRFY